MTAHEPSTTLPLDEKGRLNFYSLWPILSGWTNPWCADGDLISSRTPPGLGCLGKSDGGFFFGAGKKMAQAARGFIEDKNCLSDRTEKTCVLSRSRLIRFPHGMKRTILIYLAILTLFGAGIFLVIREGQDLPAPRAESARAVIGMTAPMASGNPASVWSAMSENMKDPLSRLLLQVIIIVLATRAVGTIFVRCGQPAVIGERLFASRREFGPAADAGSSPAGAGAWAGARELAQPDRDLLLHRAAKSAHAERFPLLGSGR